MKKELTYRQAGVDRDLGDLCSEIAYGEAKKTFAGRKGMIGEPLSMDGGFTGALDMGDYLLVQNEDGVGTKIEVAEKTGDFSTLGYDLTAMVADDAICVGAEVLSITNTIDTSDLKTETISQMMSGLGKACLEQKIVIPGGEIAELKGHVIGYTWNSTAVGIVEKHKFIDGKNIKAGEPVIGIVSPNFRSNGYTLLRAVLNKEYGDSWHKKEFSGRTWGSIALEPCIIHHAAILSLIGRFGEEPKVKIKGIAHITGGGIPGNTPRMFGKNKNLGLNFDRMPPPAPSFLELQRLGGISDREAFETWNMGIGMTLVAQDTEKALDLLRKAGLVASVIGVTTPKPGVTIKTCNNNLINFS